MVFVVESAIEITDVSQACLSKVHDAKFTLRYFGEMYGNIPHGQGMQADLIILSLPFGQMVETEGVLNDLV